jgi:catechol 2,3-dioxygenase-like lactoylglutathione lyase family enzyme
MSRLFGAIRQNGYVVRDLEAALHHWTTVLHVGPFFHLPHVAVDEFVYRGRPSPVDISIAVAFAGDLQIELIQQHNDAPSLYRDFLDAGREGLQHVSAWTPDYEATLARLSAAGHQVVQRGSMMHGLRFAYFDTEQHPGTVFEVSNCTAEPFKRMVDAMHEASRTWDGSDPIRRV